MALSPQDFLWLLAVIISLQFILIKEPSLIYPLCITIACKIGLLGVLLFFGDLPDFKVDAKAYRSAVEAYSELDLKSFFQQIPRYGNGWVYPWFFGFLSLGLGPSEFGIYIGSPLASFWAIFFIFKTIQLIAGKKIAATIVVILSLHPTFNLYSVLTMREIYIFSLFAAGIFYLIQWLQESKISFFFISFVLFALSGYLHTGFAVSVGILILVFLVKDQTPARWVLGVGALSTVTYLVAIDFSLPYVGTIDEFRKGGLFVDAALNRFTGGSKFPEFLFASQEALMFFFPIRMVYFLFAPFPWDVSSFVHLLGLLDSLFYWVIGVTLVVQYKKFDSSEALILSLLAVGLVFVFSAGTSNFGSGIRHRFKILPIFIALIAYARKQS